MIVLVQYMIHMIEALHDKYVIDAGDPTKAHSNTMWHRYDALMWVVIHCFIAYLVHDWMYIVTGLTVRLFTLQVVLNQLRGKPSYYLGNGTVDRFFKLYIGQHATLYIKMLLFILAFVYEHFYPANI